MYSSADWTIKPISMYSVDGRKRPDSYTTPLVLHEVLKERLGQFPLFNFWEPTADIVYSRWTSASDQSIKDLHEVTVHMIYLPHLDYGLQKKSCKPDDVCQRLAPRLVGGQPLAGGGQLVLKADAVIGSTAGPARSYYKEV